MVTINQIKRKLKEIQSLHQQLNSFYWGNPSGATAGEAIVYPLMGADLRPGNLGLRTDVMKMLLYFADRVEIQDEQLQVEVLSDMRRVALGVYAQFRDWLRLNNIVLGPDAPFSDFNDADWDDTCFGYQLELTITQFQSSDTCQEPSTFDPTAEETGLVRIYNIETGATVDTRNPGQEYGVLQFSGINDTGPPYTNSIVDNG